MHSWVELAPTEKLPRYMTDDEEGLLQQKENQPNTSFICNKKRNTIWTESRCLIFISYII